MRAEIVRFVVVTLVALVVVGATSTVVARAISRDVAVQEAKGRGHVFARTISAPLVDADLRAGEPAAVRAFDRVMSNRLKDGSVRHIRVWERDGSVLWADQPDALGHVFELEPEAAALFDHAGAVGWVDTGDDREHRLVAGEHELLEVYASGVTADGDRVVVETYWPTTGLATVSAHVMQRLLPLTLGTLLLFALPVLGLSVGLARRVDRGRALSADLWRQALSASDLERRRIAAALHDGVLQEVAAARYAVEAAGRLARTQPDQASALTAQAAQLIAHVAAGVRSTMVDIYPSDLEQGDLRGAIDDLVAPLTGDGILVRREIDDLRGQPVEVHRMVYRVAREALDNVRRHAGAAHVEVEVSAPAGATRLVVTDDGRGLPPGPAPEGHFGLRLAHDLARSAGGSLVVCPAPGGGTRVELKLPRRAPGDGPELATTDVVRPSLARAGAGG